MCFGTQKVSRQNDDEVEVAPALIQQAVLLLLLLLLSRFSRV